MTIKIIILRLMDKKIYWIRSAKYLLAFCVLYVGLLWVMHQLHQSPLGLTFKQRWQLMFENDWRGVGMIVASIALALTYPFFGYAKRRISGNIVTDREQLDHAADFTGLVLVSERENELIYRARGLRRLVMLFEDEVKVRQVGDEVEIDGLRRISVRMAIDAKRYITNKRRLE